ncbi:MAG: hypothetical protein HUJ68_09970 [Clostridia bacterium]|nr:hypothetical protein [Clostridia bacterium]
MIDENVVKMAEEILNHLYEENLLTGSYNEETEASIVADVEQIIMKYYK